MPLRVRNLLRDKRSRDLADLAVSAALATEERVLDILISHSVDREHVEILVLEEGERRLAMLGDLRLTTAALAARIRKGLERGCSGE